MKPLETQKRVYPHEGKYGKCRFEIIERAYDGAYARPTMRFKILGMSPREGKQWQIGEETARKLEAEGKVELVNGIVKKAIYPEDEVNDSVFIPFWSHLVSQEVGTSQKGKATLTSLFGHSLGFDTVKPTELLTHLFNYFSKESIILDFFSGSATTAHAVMQLNAEDGGNRKYIMVQLDEPTAEDSEAYKAGFKNICEIGKERIRRAAKKIKEETNAHIDYGFRVFRLDSSNMKDVYYTPNKLLKDKLFGLTSNIKEDRISEDLLVQVMLEYGLDLSLPLVTREIHGKRVHFVAGNSLVACFDQELPEDLIVEISKASPLRVVFRDDSFSSDADRINVEEIFKRFSPGTEIKVI